ncbi:FAD-dependent oxidoreductase [Actinomadura sp. KC216]|uniref:FAD-dependent oxidoreductase n=1 Tax=Actinomadura sp. KC216 TaxID=2530370 RepID=UPI00104D0856|nr:FAD-dependent oxidoreductase [Actinomadura sp. KC216]TDB86794.1 FAD-dependent oxidoreductase [Actinomadura sp. KC216]
MNGRSVEPFAARDIAAFDHECDVLVVGFGCAGAAAAFEAARAGADVIVLERASGPGGTSAQSGGELYLGGGTAIQKACGFDDDPGGMYAYLEAALGPNADTAKLRLYCDGSVEHFEWFRKRGVPFNPTFYDAPTWMPMSEDGLMWLGENSWPYNTIAKPVPRGHRPAAGGFGGGILMERLSAAATGAGAVTHTDTLATNLVLDGDGRVTGIVARKYGDTVTYRARTAVILTTGGFVDNDAMLADHAPLLLGHGKVSDGLDDGSGIRMATAIGAATRRMAVVEIALTALPAMVCRGMLVDGLGRRFLNEDVYPGHWSVHAVKHQPGPYWTIIDEEGFEDVPEPDRWGIRPEHVTETLAELEESLGMPAGSLETTVETYNRHAAKGEDPYFHKDPKWLRPLTSPFAAIDPRAGFFGTGGTGGGGTGSATGAAGFTLGGLHTTVDGEVLNNSGVPVPGLYAAGRAASGMHGEGYVSGTSLGDGTFFGRRAGRAAAREVS